MLETLRTPEVVAAIIVAIIGAGATIIAALILAKIKPPPWCGDMLYRVIEWAKAALQWVIDRSL